MLSHVGQNSKALQALSLQTSVSMCAYQHGLEARHLRYSKHSRCQYAFILFN